MDRISICYSLLKRNKNDLFLKRIITGDEKWIVYINEKDLGENNVSHHYYSKGRFASEDGDAVYLVKLEGHRVLQIPSTTKR